MKIEHRSAAKHRNVDALSRLVKDELVMLLTMKTKEEGHEELIRAQHTDLMLGPIQSLLLGIDISGEVDLNRLLIESTGYEIVDGILFKKLTSLKTVEKDNLLRLAVPQGLKTLILLENHDNILSGH